MALEIRDNIHSDIASQFPNVYRENSGFLLAFIEAYYEYMDDKLERDIPKLKDIDTTLTAFIVFFKGKYLSELPFSSDVDIRFILKHIQDLYTRKGSEESLQLLFKMFFNEDIEIFYPSNSILRASDSVFRGETFLEMKPVSFGKVESYPIVRGDTIRGDLSQANAFVDDIIFINLAGAIVPIVYLSSLKGAFSQSDAIEVLRADDNNVETLTNVGKLINGSISDVSINNALRLAGNRVGDTVDLRSNSIGQGATGIITEVSSEEIGFIDYEIIDGGWGYIDPTTVTIEYFNDIGISNRVIVVDRDTVLDVVPGDTIVFPGSTIEYDNRSGESDIHSLTGAAKIIAYRHPLLFIETRSDIQVMYDFMSQNYNTGQVNDAVPPQAVYRSVLFDHMFNGVNYLFKNSDDVDPSDQLFFPPPEFDNLLFKFFVKPNEDEGDNGIISNFTGSQQNGDLSVIDEGQQLQDFFIFYRFFNSVNNGTNEGSIFEGIENVGDALINYTSGDEIDIGVVDSVALANNVPDRIPTFQAIQATSSGSQGTGIFEYSLGDLKHGQVYTISNPGNVLTEADYINIGAKKGTRGHDFIFSEENLHLIAPIQGPTENYGSFVDDARYRITDLGDGRSWNGVGASATARVGDVFTATTTGSGQSGTGGTAQKLLVEDDRHDAIFTCQKQVYARLYQYFTHNELTPSFSIGKTLSVPGEGRDYTHYNTHFVPTDQLVPGRFYRPLDEGDLSYVDWLGVGLDLTDSDYEVNILNDSSGFTVGRTNIRPRKKYMITDKGTMGKEEFELLGVTPSSNTLGPSVGDTFYGSENVNNIAFGDFSKTFHIDNVLDDNVRIYKEDHNFRNGDKVVYIGTNSILTVDDQIDPSDALYVSKIDNDRYQLFTSETRNTDTLVVFNDTGNLGVNGTFTKQSGAPHVVDISLAMQKDVEFEAIDPQPSVISSTGWCVDIAKVSANSSDNDHKTPIYNAAGNAIVRYEWLGFYSSEGNVIDPIQKADGSGPLDVIPAELELQPGLEVIGFINGEFDHPVRCNRIGSFNDSSSFQVTAIDEEETVTLVPDIVGDVVAENIFEQPTGDDNRLEDGEYGLSGVGLETIDTEYRDAFSKVTFTLGRISELREDRPGTEYENDVGVRVVNEAISRFDKRDIIMRFENDDFNLAEGEVIEQERELTDSTIDEVNGLNRNELAAMPASTDFSTGVGYGQSVTTFEIEQEKYTAKAKFLKREDQNYFFRPITFYGFKKDINIPIKAEDRVILSITRDKNSLPMGANAEIVGSVNYDTGQIKTLAITHTGYKFRDNEVVDIINTNAKNSKRYNDIIGNAKLRTLGQGNTKGEWKTTTSFLNETTTRIHDNNYYQEYSYDISSMIDPAVYTPVVKNVVGVAGTKLFSTPLINSDNAVSSNVDVEIENYRIVTSEYFGEGQGIAGNASYDFDALADADSGKIISTESGEDFVAVTTQLILED